MGGLRPRVRLVAQRERLRQGWSVTNKHRPLRSPPQPTVHRRMRCWMKATSVWRFVAGDPGLKTRTLRATWRTMR